MEMRYRAWMVVALLGIAAPVCRAQWIADSLLDRRVQEGIDQIYDFQFDAARKTFDAVVAMRPDHPVGYFFRAMIVWERILSDFDDESHDDEFYDMLDVVIRMCDDRLEENENDVTALFFKGGAVGFRGRLRANRGKWVGAANDGLVALPLVRKAHELQPNNDDVLLGIGIYNYYAAVIPDRYPIVKPLMVFFPGGDRKKGLEQLREASLHAKYARVEASYFLMQNLFMFEKDYPKALEIARTLHARYPGNPVFYRYLGRCDVSTGLLSDAQVVFEEILRRAEQKELGYDRYDEREAHYYLGRNEFLGGRFDRALKHFYVCDELSRALDKDGPSGFMSLTNLMIGMIDDARGQRSLALTQYRKVLDMKEYEHSHDDANRYLKSPYKRP